MEKLDNNHLTKDIHTDSYFGLFTNRFIAKPIVPFLIRLGIQNPNTVSILSFILMIISAGLLLLLNSRHFINRVIVVALIEVSFVLDCSEGQIARVLNKKSLFGAWFNRYLDRIKEMALYSVIGYFTWISFGSFIYFIMGVLIGFLFNYYSLIHAEKDSVYYEEIKKNENELVTASQSKSNKKRYKIIGKTFFKNSTYNQILSMSFFFLNIGIGERYFYPVAFILLKRTDIMLIIVLILFFLRAINWTFMLTKQIVHNTIRMKL